MYFTSVYPSVFTPSVERVYPSEVIYNMSVVVILNIFIFPLPVRKIRVKYEL